MYAVRQDRPVCGIEKDMDRTSNDHRFEAAMREGEQLQRTDAILREEKRRELEEVESQIKLQVSEALTGEFFGKPQRGYRTYSDAWFPHVNFSLNFGVPGKPRISFSGEVRWVAEGTAGGGRFEDHSRCELQRSDMSALSEIPVAATITRDGRYTLDSERFIEAIANALRSARLR